MKYWINTKKKKIIISFIILSILFTFIIQSFIFGYTGVDTDGGHAHDTHTHLAKVNKKRQRIYRLLIICC